jgi:signal peptide peptidase SppA
VATDDLDAQLRAALADPGVAAIVLQCDSPGGAVAGVSELGARVYAARAVKPVVAIADSLMTSAAYWIGSQATEVWITPGGEVGSIGVYAVHMDHSQRLAQAGLKISLISAGRFKTEGNPFEALGGAGRSALQERLDAVDRMFRADVARGRGRGVMTLTGPAWEGRIVGAQDAKRAGLVDRIGTFTEAVGRAAALAKKGR